MIASGECGWQDIPGRAQAVVELFQMSVIRKVDGPDERLWITRIGESQFCVSWDTSFPEVSVVAGKIRRTRRSSG